MGAVAPFLRDYEFYTRELSPLESYVEQSAFYINLMTDRDIMSCRHWVRNHIEKRRRQASKIRNPIVLHFTRQDNGDRIMERTPLTKYIATIRREGLVLAPTGTAYIPKRIRKSMISNFMASNVKIRSSAKREAQRAEQSSAAAEREGKKLEAKIQYEIYVLKENEQKNRKTYNNAMSGTFGTMGTALNNPTAHSTLTSTTRNVSAVGNASNEKLIAGNRHYRNYQVTLNNIVAIASAIDGREMAAVMSKYDIHYPTVEETLSVIRYSSDRYWMDHRAWSKMTKVLERMSPQQRAGVVYISDLYHLRRFNPDLVRRLLWDLAKPVTDVDYSREDAYRQLKSTDEQIVNFLHQANISLVRGIGKEYAKLNDKSLSILAASCTHVTKVVSDYRDLFETYFLTRIMPASTAYLPEMMRCTVVLSDTDSTMFSVDEFIAWEFGDVVFNDDSFAFGGAVAYLATQCIGHNLALLSGNIGVDKDDMFKLAMKPEYVFPTHAQTSVAKHYWATMLVKEGNVFDKVKKEIKGVHLKSSAIPKAMVVDAHKIMDKISTTIESNQKVSLVELLTHVANIERDIVTSVRNSESKYLRRSKIKSPEGYKQEATKSPYRFHTYWQQVWAPKYRNAAEPDYDVLVIPTTLRNGTALRMWLENIADDTVRARLADDIVARQLKAMKTMYLPMALIKSYGIPIEIQQVVNIRKIVLDMTKIHRMIIDTLGYTIKRDMMIHELGY